MPDEPIARQFKAVHPYRQKLATNAGYNISEDSEIV
jgi:hypothetical protein